jgi:hypothetical protein
MDRGRTGVVEGCKIGSAMRATSVCAAPHMPRSAGCRDDDRREEAHLASIGVERLKLKAES